VRVGGVAEPPQTVRNLEPYLFDGTGTWNLMEPSKNKSRASGARNQNREGPGVGGPDIIDFREAPLHVPLRVLQTAPTTTPSPTRLDTSKMSHLPPEAGVIIVEKLGKSVHGQNAGWAPTS
jgi:hypothetical protein